MFMNHARSGFALIEVIIAITIVGIMAAGAFGVTRWIGKARVTSTKTTLRGLKSSIDEFNAETNSYPTSLSDLLVRPAEEKIAKKWNGPYLDKEVQDGWGNEFQYQLNPKGSQHPYELYSWGKGQEGSPSEEWIDVWSI